MLYSAATPLSRALRVAADGTASCAGLLQISSPDFGAAPRAYGSSSPTTMWSSSHTGRTAFRSMSCDEAKGEFAGRPISLAVPGQIGFEIVRQLYARVSIRPSLARQDRLPSASPLTHLAIADRVLPDLCQRLYAAAAAMERCDAFGQAPVSHRPRDGGANVFGERRPVSLPRDCAICAPDPLLDSEAPRSERYRCPLAPVNDPACSDLGHGRASVCSHRT